LNKILLNNAEPIQVQKIVRTVPFRRTVVYGVWKHQPVFAKVFYGPRAKQHYLRDLSGVNYLAKANILTAPLLYKDETTIDNALAYVLIFSAIEDAINAENIVAISNQDERFALAVQLVKVVASHHQANLVQMDLYLKNFLVAHQHIYTIDGDGVRHYPNLTQTAALQSLSLLLSTFDVLDMQSWLNDLLVVYAHARGWESVPDRATLLGLINTCRKKIASAYADKKVFRQCTDVAVTNTNRAFVAISTQHVTTHFPQSAAAIDGYFSQENIIKNGNTCTVVSAKIGSLDVVIKRYNIKHCWHWFGRILRRSRASISWANAHRLQLLGLLTARPVALIETKRFGLQDKAYFLTAYVDAPDIADFFANTQDKQLRSEAIKQTVQLFYRLYLLQISHGDMKASNIKVLSDGKPLLIDLDSMRQHRYAFVAQKANARDIKRFMRNWKDTPSLYNAFIKVFQVAYVDHAPLRMAKILK
jgi:tRNA A-37 threonylcarbamoyl transferase component Bud32